MVFLFNHLGKVTDNMDYEAALDARPSPARPIRPSSGTSCSDYCHRGMRHSRDGGARPRTRQTSVTLWGAVKIRLMLRKDISRSSLLYFFSSECIDISDIEPSETIGVVTKENTMKAEMLQPQKRRKRA